MPVVTSIVIELGIIIMQAQNSKKHGASAIKGIGSYKKSLIEACSIFSNVLVHLEKIAKGS